MLYRGVADLCGGNKWPEFAGVGINSTETLFFGLTGNTSGHLMGHIAFHFTDHLMCHIMNHLSSRLKVYI